MKLPVWLAAALLAGAWCRADEAVEALLPDSGMEEREIRVKLDDLAGRKLEKFTLSDATPEEAFIAFFAQVREELKMDFGPQIKEPRNPMSLRERELRNRKRIASEWRKAEAVEIFRSLMDMTLWHWSYGDRGQIVIHAWHRGDTDEGEPPKDK